MRRLSSPHRCWGCEGVAVAILCLERGHDLTRGNMCDSSAAKGVAPRVGSGKIKHLQVKNFLSQDLVVIGRAIVTKVPRPINSVDALTPGCMEEDLGDHMHRVGVEVWRCGQSLVARSEGGRGGYAVYRPRVVAHAHTQILLERHMPHERVNHGIVGCCVWLKHRRCENSPLEYALCVVVHTHAHCKDRQTRGGP